jgi:hypothetical protein
MLKESLAISAATYLGVERSHLGFKGEGDLVEGALSRFFITTRLVHFHIEEH